MLPTYDNAKSKTGHVYPSLHLFLALPRVFQGFLLVVFGLAAWAALQLASGPSAAANCPPVAATVAATTTSGAGGSAYTALTASNGPQPSEGRGEPLGPYDWEKQVLEKDNLARKFWVQHKSPTNDEGQVFYRRILVSNGWVETENENSPDVQFLFYGRFVPNIDQEFSMFKEGRHMINHIPGEFAVLNKEPFLHFMRNNSKEAGCDYTVIHPESYLIHLPDDCVEMFQLGDRPKNRFISSPETESERDSSYWFWKPPFNSFGRGIKVNSLKALRETFGFVPSDLRATGDAERAIRERCEAIGSNLTDTKAKLLVQRAIHRPYLIKGTKFDFRAYLLIANTKPWQVYFRFGHARRCLRPFDIESPVKKAHVCNDYSDEMDEMGENFPLEDHIWSYAKYKEYLVSVGYTGAEVDKAFQHNLKRLFLNVFRRFKDHVPQKNGYWILLGIDVAIDENWNSRVLEINTNPSMHYGTKTWGSEIVTRNYRQMAEQLELVYDAHKKAPLAPIPHTDLVLQTKYGWSLIYSEYTRPAFEYSTERCFNQDPQLKHPAVH